MDKLYTIAELEEMLKLSDVTIRRYIRLGKLKSQKIGRYHRITESALKQFLNEQGNLKNESK